MKKSKSRKSLYLATSKTASMNSSKPVLVIGLNTITERCACALCGTEVQPDFGPQLMLEGKDKVVCQGCGSTHAPVLVSLMELGVQAAYDYAQHLDFFQNPGDPAFLRSSQRAS